MRILAFDKSGTPTLGVRRGDEVVDLSVAAPGLPADAPGLLAGGGDALAAAAKAAGDPPADAVMPADGIVYHPPVWNPGKIICVGLNYKDHAEESSTQFQQVDEYPSLFLRVATTLAGHNQPLVVPRCSSDLDYEAEMVVVVGGTCRYATKDKALDYVAGYSVFNEGSIRDYQFKTTQWIPGKNFDATGGFGPDLVTSDEVPAGGSGLQIQTRLNGETMQNANTRDMIFDVPTLIAICSEVMTLEPGDIIVSGTPSGVGFARKPPVWMKPGDVCEIELEGVGLLSNPIAGEA